MAERYHGVSGPAQPDGLIVVLMVGARLLGDCTPTRTPSSTALSRGIFHRASRPGGHHQRTVLDWSLCVGVYLYMQAEPERGPLALYFLTFLHMPNWNENRVTIHAPTDEVKTWLVAGSDDTYFFNMHRLYPERVPADDPCGDTTWDYDWFVENTGHIRSQRILERIRFRCCVNCQRSTQFE